MRVMALAASLLCLFVTPAQAADVAQGQAKFQQLCSACHGPAGAGDGAASAGLPVKPRNLSDGAWQATVDDAYLQTVIQKGGTAVGKSPLMTPFGHSLNDAQTADVIAYIRSLKQ